MSNLVGVVLVHWNSGYDVTSACIKSLVAGSKPPEWIVVVDNASTDGAMQRLVSEFPQITCFYNSENIGFTGANNIGIEWLINQNAQFIWVLNNDTEVEFDCLKNLLECSNLSASIGVVTGKIYRHSEPNIFWNAGSTWNAHLLESGHRGSGEVDIGQYDQRVNVPFADGCCMFIKAEILRNLNFVFDNRFFAYNEDIDLSFRIVSQGFEIMYEPRAKLWHKISLSATKNFAVSGGSTSATQHFLATRNRIFILRRYSNNHLQRIFLITAFLMRILIFNTSALIILMRFNKIKYIYIGIFFGLLTNI
jgi:GT2 family glycosyltransferase